MKTFLKKYKFFIGALLILAVFVSIFTLNTSNSKTATSEIKKAPSKQMVLESWDKWIDQIDSKNGQEKIIKETKNKLATMELSSEEISEWHKRFRLYSDESPSLNIIIIPDLSLRIKQISNTPEYDKEIISEIYQMFFDKAKKHKSTDKLVLEITDNDQANGVFSDLARDLSIDMSDKKNNDNNLNYLKNKEKAFKDNLDKLYDEALKQTSGADYYYYFKRILPRRIKKSDIYNEYENKIIILTDGYLETRDRTYTHTHGRLEKELKTATLQGNLSQFMDYNNLKIPSVGYKLPNTEVLMLEITERPEGRMWHKEVLLEYWKDWFIDMGIKNVKEEDSTTNNIFFNSHEDNTNEIIKKIKAEFLRIK